MEIYLVGGAVRDKLLGLPVHERDWVVVGATPEQLLSQGYQQVGKDFPVFLHPDTQDEYALARTERKSGTGYTGFICHADPDVTLKEDLMRRDLTINAIAEDKNGNLYDPYHGKQDLDNHVLRHVSLAFREDPLRVLRLARFAARFAHLGFTIADETRQLLVEMVSSGELSALTPERVWKETEKALSTQDPQVYFEVLRGCGALKVLFPEINKLFGIPAPEKWHPEIDTGIHTLMVLAEAAKLTADISVRFAALCHDIGKGLTPPDKWPHHYGHGVLGIQLIMQLSERIRIPNEIRDFAVIAAQYHDLIHSATELKPNTIVQLFDSIDVWRRPERLSKLLLVSEADFKGRKGWQNKPYPQAKYMADAFSIVSEVTAKTVMAEGVSGPAIKQALYERRIAVLKAWKNSNKTAGE